MAQAEYVVAHVESFAEAGNQKDEHNGTERVRLLAKDEPAGQVDGQADMDVQRIFGETCCANDG
jgi:hypothetical protein